MHLAAINFDLTAAIIKRIQSENSTEIALALKLKGRDDTFACLFLDVPPAKALAQWLLDATRFSASLKWNFYLGITAGCRRVHGCDDALDVVVHGGPLRIPKNDDGNPATS